MQIQQTRANTAIRTNTGTRANMQMQVWQVGAMHMHVHCPNLASCCVAHSIFPRPPFNMAAREKRLSAGQIGGGAAVIIIPADPP